MPDAQAAMAIEFELNGAPVEATVELQTPLIDMLRERFGSTGTKRSCDVPGMRRVHRAAGRRATSAPAHPCLRGKGQDSADGRRVRG